MEPETEHQEKMDAWIADMKDGRKERTASQEATEANPEKMEGMPRNYGGTSGMREANLSGHGI
jgi:hypothetical protein